MQYSPKLKKAAEEIKAILEKYDIAGAVALHTPGFSEYILKINPSYSCASIAGGVMQFKTSSRHYDGDMKKRDQISTDTCNMMQLLADTTSRLAVNCIDGSKLLNRNLGAEHTKGGHSSHIEQNN